MNALLNWLVEAIGTMGYSGILFLMFIESTFIPLPSELVIPPAGYLIYQKQMHWFGVIASGTAGSLLGALFFWEDLSYSNTENILECRRGILGKGRIFFCSTEILVHSSGVLSWAYGIIFHFLPDCAK